MAGDETMVTREDINRLSDKIDGLHQQFVSKAEFTLEHTTLLSLISAVSAQVAQLATQVEKNRENVEKSKTDDGRWMLTKLEEVEGRLNTKLEAQNREIAKRNQWVMGLLYGTASSSIVGAIIVIATHFWR